MKKYCRNCHHPLAFKAKFCAHCGQKNTDGKIPVRELGNQLFFKIFHLESRYFKILWRLVIPGQVSIDYFKGKHKRYPPPIQFFFVIVFFFLFLLSHQPESKVKNVASVKLSGGNAHQTIQIDTVTTEDQSEEKEHFNANNFYTSLQRSSEVAKIKRLFFKIPPPYQTPQTQYAVDTLLRLAYPDVKFDNQLADAPPDTLNTTEIDFDSSSFNIYGRPIRVASADLFTMTPDELIKSYKITGWLDQMTIKQGIKTIKDPEGLKHEMIGSLGWTLFSVIGVASCWLTLLYWRRGRYYVEHFIFLLHLHSSMIFITCVPLIVNYFWQIPIAFWIALAFGLIVFNFMAMYRFYGQSLFKTFVKWNIFNVLSLISGIVLFLIGIIVTLIRY